MNTFDVVSLVGTEVSEPVTVTLDELPWFAQGFALLCAAGLTEGQPASMEITPRQPGDEV